MVQWWECLHPPPPHVTCFLFQFSAICVWVCCWFSPCSEGFSLGSLVFLPLQKPMSPNSILTRIEDLYERNVLDQRIFFREKVWRVYEWRCWGFFIAEIQYIRPSLFINFWFLPCVRLCKPVPHILFPKFTYFVYKVVWQSEKIYVALEKQCGIKDMTIFSLDFLCWFI